MRDLVRHHAGQFTFIAGGRDRAGVDEQISAGEGEGVDLTSRDNSELIRKSFAGGFGRQLCAELFDITVDLRIIEHWRLRHDLFRRLFAKLDILLGTEEIETRFESRL